MLGKAALLEPNITGFSRDFKRARYQKLAFVEIYTCIVAYIYARIYRGWQEVTGGTRDLKTAITRARSNIF